MLLQLAVITLLSAVASYAFQHTTTVYQVGGLCVYRYIAYAITVFLGYICFSQYKKYIGLFFSFALSVLPFSPIGQRIIEFFPLVAPFLAVLMGVTTIVAIPKARGRGFIEFLVILILPAILAVSRIGGSSSLLATAESVGYYDLSAIVVIVVGGCVYLRYAALTNSSSLVFLSSGGSEKDVDTASRWCNIMILAVASGASGIAAFLMATTLVVADALRAVVAVPPLYVLALAMGTGVAIISILYVFQLLHKR